MCYDEQTFLRCTRVFHSQYAVNACTPAEHTYMHAHLQTIDLLEYLGLPAKPALQCYHVTFPTA